MLPSAHSLTQIGEKPHTEPYWTIFSTCTWTLCNPAAISPARTISLWEFPLITVVNNFSFRTKLCWAVSKYWPKYLQKHIKTPTIPYPGRLDHYCGFLQPLARCWPNYYFMDIRQIFNIMIHYIQLCSDVARYTEKSPMICNYRALYIPFVHLN